MCGHRECIGTARRASCSPFRVAAGTSGAGTSPFDFFCALPSLATTNNPKKPRIPPWLSHHAAVSRPRIASIARTAYAIVFDQFAYQLRNSVYCASA